MAAEKGGQVIFVTGTDTGVGKSLVTAALARHLTELGLAVGVMKPIETGVAELTGLGPDGDLLKWAASAAETDDEISPYRFPEPLSPCQAASLAKQSIDIALLVSRCRELRKKKDIVLVEGAGGLMVPINGGYLMADLARELEASLLIVCRPGLGTLNHTLLTTFAARAMELSICGLFINGMPENPDRAEQGAPHLLSSLASADLLGVLPEVDGSDRQKVTALANEIKSLATYRWVMTALGIQL